MGLRISGFVLLESVTTTVISLIDTNQQKILRTSRIYDSKSWLPCPHTTKGVNDTQQ